ncbi:MAG: hypothetical protein ACOX5K_07915 [Bacteroidales bacterium]|jgi:hypothetical protein
MLIGAAISVITNGINNVVYDQAFFQGVGKAALIGGIGGAFSFGIGQAATGMSGFGKIAFQTLAHGHLGGMMSGFNGGSYGSGFLSGAFGSLAATGTGALLQNSSKAVQAIGMVGGGALSGGTGSELAGGNFWDGFRNGAISSGLNHGIHTGVFGEGLMMASITGKTRHLFGPDAIARTGGFSVSSGVHAGAETGRLRVLRGDDAGSYPLNDVGFGAGGIEGTLAYEKTNLYYSGAAANIKAETFYGLRWEGNFGAGAIAAIGYTGIYSALPNNEFVVGIGYSIGVGASPFILSISINWGAAGSNGSIIGNTIRRKF